MGKYLPYAHCVDAGIDWLGDVPAHWEIKKLKFLASVYPSNVDKKTKEGEQPVRLCNYTDVYYNEQIDGSLDFMVASATVEQVEKFSLRAGDTILTKDSEDRDDIAVPAYVPQSLPDVICGYHLAMVRPKAPELGAYIKRFIESRYPRSFFTTQANGLTRYGLGTYPLNNIRVLSPPADEARNIAAFLDHETVKIDRLIAKQEQLIELLKEKRQAVISHAVTKGLNPDAPMKDSGVEWLGEVPAHWEVSKIKFHVTTFEQGWSPQCDNRLAEEDEFGVLKVGCVNGGVFNPLEHKALPSELGPREEYKLFKDDLLVSRANTRELVGSAAVVDDDYPRLLLCDKLYRIRLDRRCIPEFISLYLGIRMVRDQIELASSGASQSMQNIGQDTIKDLPVPLPARRDEAEAILDFVREKLDRFARLEQRTRTAIDLMKEHRVALISAAVTGKIDVRGWQKPNNETQAAATAASA